MMSPSPPPLPPPRPPSPSADETQQFRQGIEAFVAELREVNILFAQLLARLATQTKVVAGAAIALVLGYLGLLAHGCSVAGKQNDAAAQLGEAVRVLEQVRTQQDRTQQKVEDVKAQVQQVSDEQPKIETRDGGASKSKTVVVLKGKAPPKPVGEADAGPPAPAIEVPIELKGKPAAAP